MNNVAFLQIPSSLLNRDEVKNKYVIVKVKFGNYHEEERTVMVSFHSGYIFIQTDKPIYNPGAEGEAFSQIFYKPWDTFTIGNYAGEHKGLVMDKTK